MSATRIEHPTVQVTQDRLLLWIFLVLAANGVSGAVITSIAERAPAASLISTFGVSAIVWAALTAGLAILANSQDNSRASAGDGILAAGVLLLALFPIPNISKVAMAVVAVYVIANVGRGAPARRASAIFLAVTVTLFWGPLVLGLFSRMFVLVDAFVVSLVAGVTPNGAMIPFIGQGGGVVIAPGCSSLQGISIAMVFWVTINQLFEIKLTPRSLTWCGLALLASMGINILRLAAMVTFPTHFNEIHAGWGGQVASLSQLFAIAAIVLWGARREVFQ